MRHSNIVFEAFQYWLICPQLLTEECLFLESWSVSLALLCQGQAHVAAQGHYTAKHTASASGQGAEL